MGKLACLLFVLPCDISDVIPILTGYSSCFSSGEYNHHDAQYQSNSPRLRTAVTFHSTEPTSDRLLIFINVILFIGYGSFNCQFMLRSPQFNI
jgi:hypothetical protein